jgi:hypothetical protein
MSSLSQVQGLPGMKAAKTVLHRNVTRGGWVPDVLPQGRVIAGACTRDPGNTPDVTRLRAGLLMGKIASVVNSLGTVGYYAPSILGVTTNAEAVGSTAIEASAAVVTELVRRCGASGTFKLTGPAVAGGVVVTETVTYSAASGTAITVTAIANNYVAGSFLQPTDGSEDALTFLPNGYPVMATDFDGTNLDQEFGEVPINAIVDSAQLLPAWPSDTSLQAWIVSRLDRAGGGKFTFSHIL